MATYRLSDQGDVHARVERLGTRCQISTFSGGAHAFTGPALGAGPHIACTETSWPMGIGESVVFADSLTGWDIAADGRIIRALTTDEAKERLTHVRDDVYCALDAGKEDGTPVAYLDAIPDSIRCFPYPGAAGVGGGGPGVAPRSE